jgi:hypothetical protein
MYFFPNSSQLQVWDGLVHVVIPLGTDRFLLLNSISRPSEARQGTEIKQKTLSAGINKLIPGFNWYQTSSQRSFRNVTSVVPSTTIHVLSWYGGNQKEKV